MASQGMSFDEAAKVTGQWRLIGIDLNGIEKVCPTTCSFRMAALTCFWCNIHFPGCQFRIEEVKEL